MLDDPLFEPRPLAAMLASVTGDFLQTLDMDFRHGEFGDSPTLPAVPFDKWVALNYGRVNGEP